MATLQLNQRFGKLIIASTLPKKLHPRQRVNFWLCRCDCGNEKYVKQKYLLKNITKSCGCAVINPHPKKYNRDFTDPDLARTYVCWEALVQSDHHGRKYFRNPMDYKRVEVDARWESFDAFLEDMGKIPVGCRLTRKDEAIGFTKTNCAWEKKARKTRKSKTVIYKNEKTTLQDICTLLGVKKSLVRERLRIGWTLEDAVTRPAQRRRGTVLKIPFDQKYHS